jgi:hypothetical protein
MPSLARTLSIGLVAGCLCGPALAGVYRWVDENGVTVYSQTAPPAGAAVRIDTQPGPSAGDQEAARERLKTQVEQSFDAEEEEKQAAEEAAKKAEEDARRAENCEAARANLDTLQNLGTRMVRTPDGRYLRLSEEEVAAKTEEAQRQIQEYCTE